MYMASEEAVDCVRGDKSLRTVSGFNRRIREIMLVLEKETWLPIAVRSMAVETFMNLRDEVSTFGLNLDELALQVSAISHAIFSYDESVLESEVFAMIRILDKDLTDIRER